MTGTGSLGRESRESLLQDYSSLDLTSACGLSAGAAKTAVKTELPPSRLLMHPSCTGNGAGFVRARKMSQIYFGSPPSSLFPSLPPHPEKKKKKKKDKREKKEIKQRLCVCVCLVWCGV